jgi:hypothetical protein
LRAIAGYGTGGKLTAFQPLTTCCNAVDQWVRASPIAWFEETVHLVKHLHEKSELVFHSREACKNYLKSEESLDAVTKY